MTIAEMTAQCGNELGVWLAKYGPHSSVALTKLAVGRWGVSMLLAVLVCDRRFEQDRDGMWRLR